jgi:hypothetical protein
VNKSKKLAGQVILEHDNLRLDLEDDIIEYRRKMEPEVMQAIQNTALKSRNHPYYAGKDFYIVLLLSGERVLLQPKINVWARKSCPTPVYKQAVWKYKTFSGTLEFLWNIPSPILYYYILRNKQKCLTDKETADLAKYVILMENGSLLEWVKKENGEKIDAVIKISNEENACLMS